MLHLIILSHLAFARALSAELLENESVSQVQQDAGARHTVLASLVEDDALDGADQEHGHAEAPVHPRHVPRYSPCSQWSVMVEHFLVCLER